MSAYAELHCVSNFSFLRGASHPEELIRQAHALGYRALALTDECSLAGIVRAHEALRALASPGDFRLIIGAEFRSQDAPHLVLLAPDQDAYTQLCTLITRARRNAPKGRYRLARKDFEQGLDACLALWLPPLAPESSDAYWLHAHFPARAWIAVELHRGARDARRLETLLALCASAGLPAVATGDVHMHQRNRRRLQDVLTATRHRCTLGDAGMRLYPNGERHLRSLTALESSYPPELLAESVAIAARCHFRLDALHYEYPEELVPAGSDASTHLRALTLEGCTRRWPAGTPPEVTALIEHELVLIAELRYEHFFLTVHDIVRYARSCGILCQGRGSAANSAVCYALGITEVDPARMHMLFERFISRERNEPPDIDVDFEHERREEVIQYIYAKYGRERAALAAAVICYRERSARRDVERALGIADRLPSDKEARLVAQLVEELRGFPRHLSQHVGGFVISGRPLAELVPMENAAMPGRTVIQWDKDDLESLGLLKVDVLALGMLTAIRRTLELIGRWRGVPLAVQDIPAEDSATYDMICRGETLGVFQIESRAQMSMLPRLRPRCFYDLVIEVAIIRPGPIQGNMVHAYLRNRRAPGNVSYPGAALENVLQRTLGVPIFQEQVMQIAMVAAGFSPGEADTLRRSMANWKRHGDLEPFRTRLLDGMRARGYSRAFAEQIHRQIQGFGEYGFPESHAASFALLSYVSSWLKCHEPAAFFAALLNSQPMGFYHPAQLTQEARRSGITVLPPDVCSSDWDCTLEPDAEGQAAIRLGLRQIRSLSEQDARRLIAARPPTPWKSVDALAQDTGLAATTLRRLAAAGALARLEENRHAAIWSTLGIERLPGFLAGHSVAEPSARLPAPDEQALILADYAQLGLTTGRHPLALLRPAFMRHGLHDSRALRQLPDGRHVRTCGLITHMQRPATASGVVFVSLEDEQGIINLILWPRVFASQRDVALRASLLMASGTLQNREGVTQVLVQQLRDCSGWMGAPPRRSRDFR